MINLVKIWFNFPTFIQVPVGLTSFLSNIHNNMNVGHYNLEDRFHRVRWVPNTFPSCNIASELISRVDRPLFILIIFNF